MGRYEKLFDSRVSKLELGRLMADGFSVCMSAKDAYHFGAAVRSMARELDRREAMHPVALFKEALLNHYFPNYVRNRKKTSHDRSQ